ncbi:hypothetical protein [Sphingomonas jaspsi]|uniref:hypothetical protein n=1 Tax=Sphingomonas jaspsi TaxID=392409 RepID=UPI0004ADCA41|nr:hypothetical protein [Sphingomonas jaspsi]
MTAATSTYRDRPPLRRRVSALALALAIELLLLLAFLRLNLHPKPPEFAGGNPIATFDVQSVSEEQSSSAAKPQPTETNPSPRPPIPRRIPNAPKMPIDTKDLPFIPMSKSDMAAGDIGKLGSNAPGFGADDSPRVGTAPNGEPLYAAEWYREPTNAELGGYLPKNMPEGGGAGLIACRTVAGFRVEDCVELGSDPPGSRLASAVRQAAWQFRVRPPRVGGKVLVGTWVRIRIDYLSSK